MNTRLTSTFQKIFLMLLALVIMAPLAMAFPAQAKSIPVPFCQKNCLRVTDITLEKIDVTTDPGVVQAVVTVKPFPAINDTYLGGIRITATWTLPDGSQLNVLGTTNQSGQATFQVGSGEGEFKFTILNVVKQNYVFDAKNSILTDSIK